MLLHGIGRTSASMHGLATLLADAGYATLSLDYPSRAHDLQSLADIVFERTAAWRASFSGPFHVVTHSMGGLVARVLVTRHAPARLGRIVMLAPPNGGSEIADLLARSSAYRAAFGPAGLQLGTRRAHATAALFAAPLACDVGVVAGTRALDPVGWLVLPKPNDGKVTLASTRLTGMTDFLAVPATHTFIMRHPLVKRATLSFLRTGRFA